MTAPPVGWQARGTGVNSVVSISPVHLYTPQFTMLFKTMSAAVYGIDASIIEVEVDVAEAIQYRTLDRSYWA